MSFYRKINLLLIVSLFFGSNKSNASSCLLQENKEPVKVVFKINYGTPLYQQAKQEWISKKAGGMHAFGLTEAQFQMKYEIRVRAEENCLFLDTVNILYGYPTLNVYISDKYPKDSCEYKEIFLHENKHVFYNQDALREYSKKFGTALSEIAQTVSSQIFTPGAKNVDAQINQMIRQIESHPRLRVLENSFNQIREDKHEELDRKETAIETQKKCKNW